jgi:hypothetical protein
MDSASFSNDTNGEEGPVLDQMKKELFNLAESIYDESS